MSEGSGKAVADGVVPRVLGFVFLSLLANGLVFGVADHGIHLSFLDAVFRPERWDGDLLSQASRHHHSWFWHLQAPFAAVMGPLVWTLLLHLACLAATGLVVHRLAEALFDSSLAPPLALLLLAPSQAALGGVDTLDPLLLNRGAALPLELLGLLLVLRHRATGGFVLLGIAACLHVPSAAAAACAALFAQLAVRGAWRAPVIGLLLGSSPVLIRWLLAADAPEGLSRIDSTWATILDARLSHHVSMTRWPLADWLLVLPWLLLGGLGWVRRRPASPLAGQLAGMALGLVAWSLVVGLVAGELAGVALALQLEPWQASRLLIVLCAVAGAGWLAAMTPTDLHTELTRTILVLLFTLGAPLLALPLLGLIAAGEQRGILAFEGWQTPCSLTWLGLLGAVAVGTGSIGSVVGFLAPDQLLGLHHGSAGPARLGWFVEAGPLGPILLLVMICTVWLKKHGRRELDLEFSLAGRGAPVAFLLVSLLLLSAARWPADGSDRAQLLPAGEHGEEAELARWMAENLPEDVLVAVPPQLFASERWRARRAFFVTWKDGGESLFSREVAVEWKRRLEIACQCKPLDESLPDGVEPGERLATLRERIAQGLHRADATQLAAELARENVDFLVLWTFQPESALGDHQPLHRSESFHVYSLPVP